MSHVSWSWVPADLYGGVIRKSLGTFLDQAFDWRSSVNTTRQHYENELTGDEMFAVGARISAHARELGPDLIDQELPLLSFSDGEGSLENIIYKNNHQISEQALVSVGSTYWQIDPSS